MRGNVVAASSAGSPIRQYRRQSLRLLLVAAHRVAGRIGRVSASQSRSGDLNATPANLPAQPTYRRFEELFASYQIPLLDYLYGMTRDREWAADLAQETFARAFAASPDAADIAYPQAWLYRIATNLALSALRRRKRFGWLGLSAVEPDPGGSDMWHVPADASYLRAEDIAVAVAERDAVWRVLAELPPRWRAVLLLQTTAGFGVGEIAAQLNLTEANVRKLLFRAKERFREIHARTEAKGGAR